MKEMTKGKFEIDVDKRLYFISIKNPKGKVLIFNPQFDLDWSKA